MIAAVIAMESEAEILLHNARIATQKRFAEKDVRGRSLRKAIRSDRLRRRKGKCGDRRNDRPYALFSRGDFKFRRGGRTERKTSLCAVYAIDKAVQFDFDLTQLNGGQIGTLDEYTENYLSFATHPLSLEKRALGSSDRFNDSRADYELLTKTLKADIRDMEGAAILQAAKSAGVKAFSVKAISDVAGSGSTTEQFLKTKPRRLQIWKKRCPESLRLSIDKPIDLSKTNQSYTKNLNLQRKRKNYGGSRRLERNFSPAFSKRRI